LHSKRSYASPAHTRIPRLIYNPQFPHTQEKPP
jgi:hypothetical protein